MKYFYILIIGLIFIGCEPVETEQEKLDRLTREDNNIIYGGTGTISDPYKIYNGVYGALSNGDFYYSFDLTGSNCSAIFYTKTGYIASSYPIWKNLDTTQLMDINQSNEYYVTYNKDLNTSKYLLKVSDIDIPNDKFGFYSACGGGTYEITKMIDSGYTFTAKSNLYELNITSISNVKFTDYEHLSKIQLFDNNFTLLENYSFATVSSYQKALPIGLYYVLAEGYNSTDEVIFNVDIN